MRFSEKAIEAVIRHQLRAQGSEGRARAAAMTVTARESGAFRLTGTKLFVLDAHVADALFGPKDGAWARLPEVPTRLDPPFVRGRWPFVPWF